jgi:diguanylate cyclase (GGDEF)-like protein
VTRVLSPRIPGFRAVADWVRSWRLWAGPPAASCYIVALTLAWLAAVAVGLATTTARLDHALTFALLVACGAAAIEATRRLGEPAGPSKDLLSAWWLPIAFVLPPVYSLLAPVVLMALSHLRLGTGPWYRRITSVAAIGLAFWSASWAFHLVSTTSRTLELAAGLQALAWTGTALLCAVLATFANSALIGIAVSASSPEVTLRGLVLDTDNLVLDWGEVCIGVILALLCTLNPLLALLALTPVLMLQRGLMHDQLKAAARLDTKTELLNAPTWEREATLEIARAVRTRSALSVLLLDLDHFKQVNDFFGHLVGDDVIRGVAGVLTAQTREYDRCARFGGDEFAVLLPQADAEEAQRTAERIRRNVAGLAVPTANGFVAVSISVGVAHLASPDQDITDLLAAADSDLYRAKRLRPPAPTTPWELERQ